MNELAIAEIANELRSFRRRVPAPQAVNHVVRGSNRRSNDIQDPSDQGFLITWRRRALC